MPSSGNFATWNRLANVNPSLSYSGFTLDDGNCRFRGNTGGTASITSSLSMPSGKWYVEIYAENSTVGGWPTLGILKTSSISKLQNVSNYQSYSSSTSGDRSEVAATTGNVYKFGATTGVSGGSTFTNGDVLQIAVDIDAGKWWFGKNNSYSGSGDPAGGNYPIDTFTARTEMSVWAASYNGTCYLTINAGQDSTFNGNLSAGTGADDNGFGNFKYSPPSGFLALCSGNLPISSNIDPAQTNDDYPEKSFKVLNYSGGTSSITGLGFQPDLVWVKRTDGAQGNGLFDSSRGTSKVLQSDSTGAENTSSGLTAFDSDGYTMGTYYNQSGNTYVSWCWKANGGNATSNSSGTITASVQANTKAGFSIATYTSPGSGTNHTIGHGLSGVDFIITKDRSSTFNWYCFHSAVANKTYRLNSGSEHSYSNWSMGASTWGSEDGYTHNSTDNFVAYCWQNVEGMQKFGSYEGSGNADGPFVYLGFRPALLVLKRTSSSGFWNTFYSPTKTFNSSANDYLTWNTTDSKANGVPIDFLSNGFKVRNTGSGVNGDGNTYLYMAWSGNPFKYNNAF